MNDRIEYCYDCSRHERTFEYGMALINYDETAKRSMAQVKYHNKREYLDFYAEAIVRRYGRRILRISPDALIPVPVHPSKMRMRGYNQAEILAEKISKRLETEVQIPVFTGILKRNRKTAPQKNLSPEERFKNLKQAFTAADVPQNIHTVLLIDDIYTTGSTIEACTQALKKSGIENVYFLTICIGYGK